YFGDAVLHRFLHLLERTHVDLADALGRDAEFGGQVGKCGWVLREPTRFEDTPLAIVEHAERRGKRLAAGSGFLTPGGRRLPAGRVLNPPSHPSRAKP